MAITDIVKNAKAFSEGLSSEQLEIICNVNFDKLKPKKKPTDPDEAILSNEDYLIAIEWQFYALVELTSRLEYGFNNTATDKWEASSYRKKAKRLRQDALQMEAEALRKKNKTKHYEWDKIDNDAWYLAYHTAVDAIRDPSNPVQNT